MKEIKNIVIRLVEIKFQSIVNSSTNIPLIIASEQTMRHFYVTLSSQF